MLALQDNYKDKDGKDISDFIRGQIKAIKDLLYLPENIKKLEMYMDKKAD